MKAKKKKRATATEPSRIAGSLRLGLALSSLSLPWAGVTALALLYGWTMAEDLCAYDSAELALVATQFGLGHPTGQPAHTLLGGAVTSLGVEPLWGLSTLSAAFGSLCFLPLWSLIEQARGKALEGLSGGVAFTVVVAALLHPWAWEPSTRIEVYAPATFFALWAVARTATLESQPRRTGFVRWTSVGVALGLAASFNPYIAVLGALALVEFVIRSLRKAARATLVRLASVTLGGLVGLLPYLYIPAVAGRENAFVWGSPTDADALWFYLSGADYGFSREASGGDLVTHAGALIAWAWTSAGALIVGTGALLALKFSRPLGRSHVLVPTAATVLLLASNAVFHPEVDDYLGYWHFCFGLSTVVLATAIVWCIGRTDRARYYGFALAAVLSISCIAIPPAFGFRGRARDLTVRTIATESLREAPQNALMIVDSDHLVAPTLYLQEIEGVRPDVAIMPRGLASSSWYWRHLYRRHPRLRPFEVRGPGGRVPRLRRWIDAQGDVPVVVEQGGLAQSLGLRICEVGWLIQATRQECPASRVTAHDVDGASRQLAERSASGWTTSRQLIARSALYRAEARWRAGSGGAAATALSGVSPQDRPPAGFACLESPGRIAPLRAPFTTWERGAALGDPARNLYLAAQVCAIQGDREGAAWLLTRAAQKGLPEAQP